MNNTSVEEAYIIIFKEFPDVVGVKEAGKMLGICSKKVYQLIRKGDIPIIHYCKSYKIAKLNIIEYILNKTK